MFGDGDRKEKTCDVFKPLCKIAPFSRTVVTLIIRIQN